MKLLTEMQDGCVHVNGCCVDFTDLSNGVLDKLEHDAAAAHALWLSLHQLDAGPRKWVEDDADELMKQWGFDSGEVE
jgi:hypothetical protein